MSSQSSSSSQTSLSNARAPRVYLFCHGETEWTKTGCYASTTDLEFTAPIIQQLQTSRRIFVGLGKLIDDSRLMRVFMSPQNDARKAYDHLFPWPQGQSSLMARGGVFFSPNLGEWRYGIYEGMTEGDVQKMEDALLGANVGRPYDIWQDGCVMGESPEDVSIRLDQFIWEVQKLQLPYMNGGHPGADILVLGLSQTLLALTKRWLRLPIQCPLSMTMDFGSVAVLSYLNHDIGKPTLVLGVQPEDQVVVPDEAMVRGSGSSW